MIQNINSNQVTTLKKKNMNSMQLTSTLDGIFDASIFTKHLGSIDLVSLLCQNSLCLFR